MREICKTAGRWIVIAAMMSAFGGHWMLLQSVAWTTMMVDNVKHTTLGQALERTFDGQHPCQLCQSIEKGRKSEKQGDAQFALGKINFFFETTEFVLVCPRPMAFPLPGDAFASGRVCPPILQPPRISIAA